MCTCVWVEREMVEVNKGQGTGDRMESLLGGKLPSDETSSGPGNK